MAQVVKNVFLLTEIRKQKTEKITQWEQKFMATYNHNYIMNTDSLKCLACHVKLAQFDRRWRNILYKVSISFALYYFYPSALRPEGYCRCLRPSVCLSVCPSVCLSVCLSVRPYDHACPRDNSKNIFQIFSKLAWNILWVNISDKFDDGYRSSLNMRIIDQKVTLTFFEFLK